VGLSRDDNGGGGGGDDDDDDDLMMLSRLYTLTYHVVHSHQTIAL